MFTRLIYQMLSASDEAARTLESARQALQQHSPADLKEAEEKINLTEQLNDILSRLIILSDNLQEHC